MKKKIKKFAKKPVIFLLKSSNTNTTLVLNRINDLAEFYEYLNKIYRKDRLMTQLRC